VSGERVFHASAPVRLDFAGGWTDVAPFAVEERGVVVNAAIELRAHAAVQPGGTDFLLEADELHRRTQVQGGVWTAKQTAGFTLQKAALQRSGMAGAVLQTRSDVPPGSGLGSSGALGVALVAALDAARTTRRKPVDLAEAAFQLEAVDAALPGGKQDQYAAALGGFHRLGFTAGLVEVQPLALDPAIRTTLQEQLVVCYTGTSRVSSQTISRVMSAYAAHDAAVVAALRGMVEIAERMVEALRAGDLAAVGRLLSRNWSCQQQLDRGMCTPEMARLEAAMRQAGALGGKAAGAGAGGSMFFLAAGEARLAARAAEAVGARVLPFRWAEEGVQTW
jgi:D-glycero-alpha-D-manno-heptose-7-phosphate kinase